MQQAAIRAEVIDPRERRYLLSKREDFRTDWPLVCRRYADLADAPNAHDARRFPPRKLVQEWLNFNREYRLTLESNQGVDPGRWWEYEQAIRETKTLYRVWDYVADAQWDGYFVAYRRNALKQLRELVGAQAYYSGELPPPAPLWRFEQLFFSGEIYVHSPRRRGSGCLGASP